MFWKKKSANHFAHLNFNRENCWYKWHDMNAISMVEISLLILKCELPGFELDVFSCQNNTFHLLRAMEKAKASNAIKKCKLAFNPHLIRIWGWTRNVHKSDEAWKKWIFLYWCVWWKAKKHTDFAWIMRSVCSASHRNRGWYGLWFLWFSTKYASDVG